MLFDADCGFCARTAAKVHLLGVRVEGRPYQDVDLLALGVDPERCIREMPVVTPDGVQYGHRAWAAILATGPAPARAVGTLMRHRPIEPLARRVYTWVSGNRHRLPGGTPHCAVPPLTDTHPGAGRP